MKLPFGLGNKNKEENTNVTKKSTTIAKEEPVTATPINTAPPLSPEPISEEDWEGDEELFNAIQTILENQFMARDENNAVKHNTESILTMLSTLIKLLSSGSGALTQSGASAEDVTDMRIVVVTQRKIITTLLTSTVLDEAAREAMAKTFVEMPEWEVLEAAEKRLKEREANRKALNELQKEQG